MYVTISSSYMWMHLIKDNFSLLNNLGNDGKLSWAKTYIWILTSVCWPVSKSLYNTIPSGKHSSALSFEVGKCMFFNSIFWGRVMEMSGLSCQFLQGSQLNLSWRLHWALMLSFRSFNNILQFFNVSTLQFIFSISNRIIFLNLFSYHYLLVYRNPVHYLFLIL